MDDLAAKLRAISERVARNVPHRRDPERFHVEKSCICQDLEHLAQAAEEASLPWKKRTITVNRQRQATVSRVTAQQVFRR